MATRRKRRWWRCLAALGILIVLIVAVPVIGVESACRPTPVTVRPIMPSSPPLPEISEPGYRRPEANTYFTFPEWYIVYSFEDFGRFLDHGSESGFPYLSHILGFWRSFCTISRTGAVAPFDTQMMIYVIGISYSIEYAIKGFYENTLGRLAEWTRAAPTPEDKYAKAVAQDYAEFLYTVPWYKYPFREKLRGLWKETPPAASVRSWERKLALSAEYGVKSGYAWLIAKGLDVSSEPEARDIMLVVSTLSAEVLAKEPRIRVLRQLDAGRQLILVPRYKAFTEIVKGLAAEGQAIVEIAGNDDILLTAIMPEGETPVVEGVHELFSLPLGARPGFRRVGLEARVESLTRVLPELEKAGATVEHLYDY